VKIETTSGDTLGLQTVLCVANISEVERLVKCTLTLLVLHKLLPLFRSAVQAVAA